MSQNVLSLSDCSVGNVINCSVLNVQEKGVTLEGTSYLPSNSFL